MPDAAPLRVCRVIARLNVGGPARHVALLDRGLRARGFTTLLAHGDVAPGEASLESLAQSMGNPSIRIAHLGRRISAASDARAFVALVRLMFRERPDIVHTHTAKAGTLGRLAAAVYNVTRRRSRRCLVVHTFHGNVFSGYFGPAASMVVRAIERTLALVTDRIATIAEQQRSEIVDRFAIAPASKVSVIPLGLDLRALLDMPEGAPSLRSELELADDDIVFGFVGRFAPIKDVPTLVAAFARMASSEPRARLVLAGDGETRPAFERLVREAGVESRVRFAGWRSDLPRLYATFDVVVLSSKNEGTPVAVIEAMAAGLPVISTTAGGVVDVVGDGVTGLLVPVGDAGAFAAAMVRASASPAQRKSMGTAGRRIVEERYGHERLVRDVEALYRSALPPRRGLAS